MSLLIKNFSTNKIKKALYHCNETGEAFEHMTKLALERGKKRGDGRTSR